MVGVGGRLNRQGVLSINVGDIVLEVLLEANMKLEKGSLQDFTNLLLFFV